jgi:hypothetical protein
MVAKGTLFLVRGWALFLALFLVRGWALFLVRGWALGTIPSEGWALS